MPVSRYPSRSAVAILHSQQKSEINGIPIDNFKVKITSLTSIPFILLCSVSMATYQLTGSFIICTIHCCSQGSCYCSPLHQILHLVIKRTMRTKSRGLSFCYFLCVYVCLYSRDPYPCCWMTKCHFTCSVSLYYLHSLIYRDTDSTQILFNNNQR